MEKINFEDLPSTKTPIDSANLNLLQTNIENAINGTSLFEGSTNGDVTLSDNVTNYRYVEIFYNAFGSQNHSVKAKASETNVILLQTIHAGTDGSINFNTRGVTLNQNKIVTNSERYSSTSISLTKEISITHTNNINITKVVGYK